MIRRCYLAFPVEIFEILFPLELLLFLMLFFVSPVFWLSLLFFVFFFLRHDLRRLVLLRFSLFRLFFFSVLISFLSVFRFRAISTFSSGVRGPLERGTGMAGTGGLVKRPNLDNASFESAALPKTLQKMSTVFFARRASEVSLFGKTS